MSIVKNKDELLTTTYFNIYNDYKKQYQKPVVLFQIGKFYEIYSTLTDGEDVVNLSNLLHIQQTFKKKEDYEKTGVIDHSNPMLIGFPIITLTKYMNILLDNNYTVIVIDEVEKSDTKQEVKREVTGVYSLGTYFSDTQNSDNNFICSIYFQSEKQVKGNTSLLTAGMVSVDITTGEVYVHDVYSSVSDPKLAEDECLYFLNYFNPKEILMIQCENCEDYTPVSITSSKYIKNYVIITGVEQKIIYQNQVLQKIFDCKGLLSPMITLSLTQTPYATIVLVTLLNRLANHNPILLRKLSNPKLFNKDENMILGVGTLSQLDIINDNGISSQNRDLFSFINFTSTSMGKRALRYKLMTPRTCVSSLEKDYDFIDRLIKDSLYLKIEPFLKKICDLTRLFRRIDIGIMSPIELKRYYSSFKIITELSTLFPDLNLGNISDFTKEIESVFNMDNLKETLHDITLPIFQDRLYPNLDDLFQYLTSRSNFVELLAEELCFIAKFKQLKLKINKTDGQHFTLSSLQSKKLQSHLADKTVLNVKGNMPYNISNLVFKNGISTSKILLKGLNNCETKNENEDDKFIQIRNDITTLSKTYFITKIKEIHDKYYKKIQTMINNITELDVNVSNAKVAIVYNYTRPKVEENKKSFISVENLRHPIVERLINYEYVPHSLSLETKNILLGGLNSSGKSTIMKAVGIVVILAQAGMFVPCNSCKIGVYSSMFTRITGDDDMYNGLSSFSKEMSELKTILTRSTPNTLIISDEICRGTEHISALSIVASTVITLSKKNVSFIFTTHLLHQLYNIKLIREIENKLGFYYLTVTIEPITNRLTYSRELVEGLGCKIYGVLVAQSIIKDCEFMDLMIQIKNEIVDEPYHGYLVTPNISRYNAKTIVSECYFCQTKQNLHTHHLHFQKNKNLNNNFTKDNSSLHIHSASNLVVLCESCHTQLHNDDLHLSKKLTSDGVEIM